MTDLGQALVARVGHALRRPGDLLAGLNKNLCEANLLEFAETIWTVVEPKQPFVRGWAIEAIAEHLEAVTRGEIHHLLINVPPGLMKSLLTNVFWPAWEWGPRNLPHHRFLSASYSQDLTIRDNRRCRTIIDSDLYRGFWGDRFSISLEQDAKVRYDNDKTGWRIASSVGGLGTGERGDRFVIDDPHNVKTAESEARLEEIAQWLTEVVPSRVNNLNPNPNGDQSAFVMIMQRVHQRDASGVWLEAGIPGLVHLELPMEFEEARRCSTAVNSNYHLPDETTFTDPRRAEGELLFPERYSTEGVTKLKAILSAWGGEYAVAGQLQQRPAPRGGGMFKTDREPSEMYIELKDLPTGGMTVRGWDIAGSSRKKSPYTASVKLRYYRKTLYIIDVTRDRLEIEQAEEKLVGVVREDGRGTHQSIPQDPGSAGKSQKSHLGKELQGYEFSITPESGDKADRAIPVASQWNNGNIKMVRAPWNAAFLAELAFFPRGTFKDQVDALSRAYQRIISQPTSGRTVGVEVITADD